MSAAVLDSRLYWTLPGPERFMHRVAAAVANARALVINTPSHSVLALDRCIEDGIKQAGYHPVVVELYEGIDLSKAVGERLGMGRAPAGLLATHLAQERLALLLVAPDARQRELSNAYVSEFMDVAAEAYGNVPLVVSIHAEEIREDGPAGAAQVLNFDGGLNYEEMSAYVAIQMLGRKGPGSTTLLRSVVREFAGFDASFAQRLAGLEEAQLLGIREHLHTMMSESSARWRSGSWLSGCRSLCHDDNHALYDQYLADHGQAGEQEKARQRIERRYWRACLRALVPWLEERRLQVVSTFFPQLQADRVEVRRGARDVEVERETLEYNDIVGLKTKRGVISPSTNEEHTAYAICSVAKHVRNELAHMRSPDAPRITELIHRMDEFTGVGMTSRSR